MNDTPGGRRHHIHLLARDNERPCHRKRRGGRGPPYGKSLAYGMR